MVAFKDFFFRTLSLSLNHFDRVIHGHVGFHSAAEFGFEITDFAFSRPTPYLAHYPKIYINIVIILNHVF